MYGGGAEELPAGTPGTLDAIELPSLDLADAPSSGAMRQSDIIENEGSGPIDVSPMGDDGDDEDQDEEG